MKSITLILAALAAGSGCSVLFSAEGETPPDASASIDAEPDAEPGVITEARIGVDPPICGDNVFTVGAGESTSAEGTDLSDYRWTVLQNEVVIDEFSGSPDTAVAGSTHILSGTATKLTLNPSLLSAPTLLRVTITSTTGTNQVFQRGLLVESGINYELSFVAASDGDDVLHAHLLRHAGGQLLATPLSFNTSTAPVKYTASFTATGTDVDSRLRFDLDSVSGYWIDNVQLRRAGQSDIIENGQFDSGLPPWQSNFAGAGAAGLAGIPPFLATFPDTTIRLVVVDSSGFVSAPAEVTIDSSQCIAQAAFSPGSSF